MSVRRINLKTSVISIEGEMTGAAEYKLLQDYDRITSFGTSTIILDMRGMTYMNSAGIGLIISLLNKVRAHGQCLMAYGLNEHFRQIFEITQLNRLIPLYASEQQSLDAARDIRQARPNLAVAYS